LATKPFSKLLFTSLNGRTKEKMNATNNAGHSRWRGTEWWEESYDSLWREGIPTNDATTSIGPALTDTTAEVPAGGAGKPSAKEERSCCPQDSVVYLTADALEELSELKEGETYIIGGICDHNRYKVYDSIRLIHFQRLKILSLSESLP
jgi:tRNA (guanine9-N1)-methyltransferase